MRKQIAEEKGDPTNPIWEYISRHALVSMGIIKNVGDPAFETYLEGRYIIWLLWGIRQGYNDKRIVSLLMETIDKIGFYPDEDNIASNTTIARSKCQQEVFVLGIALDLLYSINESPSTVYLKVRQLLD